MKTGVSEMDRLPFSPEQMLDVATLAELRGESVRWAFCFVFAVGLTITACVQAMAGTTAPRLLALLLMITPLAAWVAHRVHHRAGIWLLIGGCLVAILVAQLAYPSSVAFMGLAFLVGLAGFFDGKWAGVGMAGVATAVVLLLPRQVLAAPVVGTVPMALLLIWGTALLAWTSTDPLYAFVRWSWYYYVQARGYARQIGDRQVEQQQALEDLQEANRQLEYLNRIVHAARAEAEEARRTKVEFVANVSHELRTPLNMIIGFSETLLAAPRVYGAKLPPALMADIDAIYRNGCHLQGLIDDVLDLSQIDMHRMALIKERTDLRALVSEAIEAVRYLYDTKGLTLTAELPPRLPELLCDRTRIREVLLNLLSNAGRFTERGGTVVRASEVQGCIVVSVADSGPGIAPEQLKKVFEPFQQLDSGIRRRFGGSGLGLAISRAFVEMHQGRMWIESELERGTVVSFELPLPYQPEPAVAGAVGLYTELRARPLRPPIVPTRPRLAVIDDGQMLQRLVTRYLPEVEVVPVADLAQASAIHATHPFQSLWANAATPEELASYLTAEADLPSYVPLLVSAFSASQGTDLLGAAGYLVKPITRAKLMAALTSLPQPVETILIADDDPDVPQLFDRMLGLEQGRHFRLLQATNGREALHMLRMRRPDVLLLDLMMPEMDGYQVLREKNADPTISDIPVLIISARDLLEQPLTSPAILATRREGLSVPEVLSAVTELNRILGLLPLTADPGPPRRPSA